MRGLRSFVALLIVAVALGWYALRESKKPASEATQQEKVFPDLKSDAIDQVTIKSEAGDRTTVEKKSNAWQVTEPLTVKADEAELSGITSNLSSLEIQRVVDEQASDFKQYSLDPAKIELDFKAGGKEHKLLVGQKTPTGSDLYARLPDKPRVFLIPSYLESTFNRSTFDLRDKTVLSFDRDKVDHMTIAAGDHTTTFAKQGNDWKITSPVDARADFGAVEGIIGRINTAQMKAITATDPKDLKEYGLDKPTTVVTLAAGSAKAALELGKSAGEGVVYARDTSRPIVFTVESTLADEIKKPADDFRVKDLFDARAFNTTRIEIARGGQTVAFEKAGDKWKQVAPSVKDVDAGKVEALMTALSNTRATGFVETTANTGLDTPDLSISVKYEDGQKQEHVNFAKHGSDAFAQRQGDAGAAKIDAASLDAITKAIEDVK